MAPITKVTDKAVVAGAPDETVVPLTPVQGIGAATAFEVVGSTQTVQRVVALAAE